jgi:hypothetical protein
VGFICFVRMDFSVISELSTLILYVLLSIDTISVTVY